MFRNIYDLHAGDLCVRPSLSLSLPVLGKALTPSNRLEYIETLRDPMTGEIHFRRQAFPHNDDLHDTWSLPPTAVRAPNERYVEQFIAHEIPLDNVGNMVHMTKVDMDLVL